MTPNLRTLLRFVAMLLLAAFSIALLLLPLAILLTERHEAQLLIDAAERHFTCIKGAP